jgi:dCTP deaminase
VILSDRSIREALAAGRIVIDPLDEGCLQPSSIDVKVSHLFRVFRNHSHAVIDVKKELVDLTELVEMKPDEAFVLHPGEFVLGSTLERVAIANDLVARVEGKSSLGRLGLLIHSTAGFIGQVSFMTMTTPADKPYGSGARGSKYQGQRGPTPSRYFENFQ